MRKQKADEKDIQATLDFLSWVITSDEGRESISQEMGFTTPFKTFDENYESANPLVKAADEYVKAGKLRFHGTLQPCLLKSGKTRSAVQCLSMHRVPASGML